MNNNTTANSSDFLILRPRGTKQNGPNNKEAPSADSEIALKIKSCRRAFMERIKNSQNNQQNVYRSLGCKVPFILKYLPGTPPPEFLEDILADRSTLFSDGYADAQLNRSAVEHLLQRYGTSPEAVHDYCAGQAWDEYCSQVRAKAREAQAVVMDALRRLDSIARKTSNGIEYYRNKLRETNNAAADGQEAEALLHQLKSWDPDIAIRPNCVIGFYLHCFESYCNRRREYRLLRKEIGRFKPDYTQNDADEFDAYQSRKKQLTCFRKACIEWNQQNGFPFSASTQMTETPLSSGFDRTGFLRLVEDYLTETRGKNGLNEEQALQALRCALFKHDLAPTRFLIICVHKREALILYRNGAHRDLDLDDIRSFEQHVYRKTPPVDKQRISRLKLLLGLCKLLNCTKKQVQNNLLYFLKYHGYAIAAEEEAALWKQALEAYDLMDEPVSLALRYYTNRLGCISFDPQSLYCYEACSQLHLGGWLSFIENDFFRRLLEDKAHKKQIKIDHEDEYLEEWASDEPDISKIKALCAKAAQQQETIKAITRWIEQWDEASRTEEHWTTRAVDADELYCLLIESAIQYKLIRRAQKILLDNISDAIPAQ